MRAFLYLAFRHLSFHAGRSVLVVGLLAVLAAIPLIGHRMAALAEMELMARAEATPMIYGPAGSRLDLALGALFFAGPPVADLTMADYDALMDQDLATVIPILRTHTAQGAPVVGVDIEYLTIRGLDVAAGRPMVQLGEAVVGASAARRLGLAPGGEVQSDATGPFDIAGAAPLRLSVTGVLAPSGTADDDAILTGLRTAWLVAGIGHGHIDVETTSDRSVILSSGEGAVVANAKLPEAVRVTDENRGDFHFHGDPADYPVSALIVVPDDDRSGALLRGRVEDGSVTRQIFRPTTVIGELLGDIFRVRAVFDVVAGVLGTVGLVALGAMIALTLRLRRAEFELARRLGADRAAMTLLVATELALMLGAGIAIALALTALAGARGTTLLRWALFGGG